MIAHLLEQQSEEFNSDDLDKYRYDNFNTSDKATILLANKEWPIKCFSPTKAVQLPPSRFNTFDT